MKTYNVKVTDKSTGRELCNVTTGALNKGGLQKIYKSKYRFHPNPVIVTAAEVIPEPVKNQSTLLCKYKGCRREPKKSGYCYRCVHRVKKENHPERYAYDALKCNARRRGKEFTITFEYFLKFAKRTDYMAGKGITKQSLHVDRKDETKGYIPGNLQVLTNEENHKKYMSYSHDEKGKPTNFKFKKSVLINNQNDPF